MVTGAFIAVDGPAAPLRHQLLGSAVKQLYVYCRVLVVDVVPDIPLIVLDYAEVNGLLLTHHDLEIH